MSSQAAPVEAHEHHDIRPIRKAAMWVFLGSECMFFGSMIATFLLYRNETGDGPGSEIFDIPFTSASSFVLLMSSLTMVLAHNAFEKRDARGTRIWLAATALLGTTFLAGQIFEFTEFVHEGLTLSTSSFGSAFYMLTGFHGAHVAIGVLMLLAMFYSMKKLIRHKYIDYNPVRDAERPKDQGEEEKPSIKILNPLEMNALIDATKGQKYKTLFKLAIMSGARQGELLGLKWTDVDWFNNQVHIQRTYNKGTWYRPKSKNSDRKIDLGPSMMAKLKKWKMACPPNELGLVFPNAAGNPMCQSHMISRHFFRALESAGVERIRFHDLRHTYASLLIEQGENIKYIQNQLGHSSPTVTLNVYAHLMRPANQESACRLENTVFGTSGSKMVAETKKGSRYYP